MEGITDPTVKESLLRRLTVFDPERPPYEPQHLCEYLRELDEEADAERSGAGTPG